MAGEFLHAFRRATFLELYPMHHFFLRLSLMVVFITLVGCATANKVTQDYKPDTDFHSYKTFSWHNFSSDIANTDQLAIQHAVEQQLTQQGFSLVNANPDLILDLNIIKQRSSGAGGGVGLSIGLPIGNHGSIGLGTNKRLDNDNQMAGLIILDITAPQSNQVIWRASAEAVPVSYIFLRNQALQNSELNNLVKQIPPK